MRKKLIFTYIVIIILSCIITASFATENSKKFIYEESENKLELHINYLEDIIKHMNLKESELDNFVEKYTDNKNNRITIVRKDGVVVADSEHDTKLMDNHKYRDEIKSALNGQKTITTRRSTTMDIYFMYIAKKIQIQNKDYVLRVAVSLRELDTLVLSSVKSIGIGVFIGIIISSIIAYFFTKGIIKPIEKITETVIEVSNGDYDKRIYIDNDKRLKLLAKAFNKMTLSMSKSIWEVETKNAELEAILKSMNLGVVAIDENYNLIFFNNTYINLMEINDIKIGSPFYETNRNRKILEILENAVETGDFIEKEINLNNKILKVNAVQIRSSNNKYMQGVLIILEDISNLRKLETYRSDFVANVTHELKTPLTSIKGFVEILKEDGLQDKELARKSLDIVEIETTRLTSLINDILLLSEIETINADRNMSKIDIADIAFSAIEILRDKADKKHIELELNLKSKIPLYYCNPDRIKQIFINIIDNAIKYSEKGIIKIEIEYLKETEILVIRCIDEGIGIPKESIERIFERFYRVDKGRSRSAGGTGLGLSIIKHIVDLYSGTIVVKSNKDKGSVFEIRLPYKK